MIFCFICHLLCLLPTQKAFPEQPLTQKHRSGFLWAHVFLIFTHSKPETFGVSMIPASPGYSEKICLDYLAFGKHLPSFRVSHSEWFVLMHHPLTGIWPLSKRTWKLKQKLQQIKEWSLVNPPTPHCTISLLKIIFPLLFVSYSVATPLRGWGRVKKGLSSLTPHYSSPLDCSPQAHLAI